MSLMVWIQIGYFLLEKIDKDIFFKYLNSFDIQEYPGATDRMAENGTKKGFTKLVRVS